MRSFIYSVFLFFALALAAVTAADIATFSLQYNGAGNTLVDSVLVPVAGGANGFVSGVTNYTTNIPPVSTNARFTFTSASLDAPFVTFNGVSLGRVQSNSTTLITLIPGRSNFLVILAKDGVVAVNATTQYDLVGITLGDDQSRDIPFAPAFVAGVANTAVGSIKTAASPAASALRVRAFFLTAGTVTVTINGVVTAANSVLSATAGASNFVASVSLPTTYASNVTVSSSIDGLTYTFRVVPGYDVSSIAIVVNGQSLPLAPNFAVGRLSNAASTAPAGYYQVNIPAGVCSGTNCNLAVVSNFVTAGTVVATASRVTNSFSLLNGQLSSSVNAANVFNIVTGANNVWVTSSIDGAYTIVVNRPADLSSVLLYDKVPTDPTAQVLSSTPVFSPGHFQGYQITVPSTQTQFWVVATFASSTSLNYGIVNSQLTSGGVAGPFTLSGGYNSLRINNADGSYPFTIYRTLIVNDIYVYSNTSNTAFVLTPAIRTGAPNYIAYQGNYVDSVPFSTKGVQFWVDFTGGAVNITQVNRNTFAIPTTRVVTSTFDLDVGVNTFIVSSVADGRTYTVTIRRSVGRLTALQVLPSETQGNVSVTLNAITPRFNASDFGDYQQSVPYSVVSIRLLATFTTDAYITVRYTAVGGNTVNTINVFSGVQSDIISLPAPPSNAAASIQLTVSSPADGDYSLTINRQPLDVNGIQVIPRGFQPSTAVVNDIINFQQGRFNYSANVATNVTLVYLNITNNAGTLNGTQIIDGNTGSVIPFPIEGQPRALLRPGNNLIRIVSVRDGTYNINVFRDPDVHNVTWRYVDQKGISVDIPAPFTTGVFNQAFSVPFAVSAITLAAIFDTVDSVNWDISAGTGVKLVSGAWTGAIPLTVGAPLQFRVLSSLDGIYTFTVTRQSPDVTALALTSAQFSGAMALTPAFAAPGPSVVLTDSSKYTVTVPYVVQNISVTATFGDRRVGTVTAASSVNNIYHTLSSNVASTALPVTQNGVTTLSVWSSLDGYFDITVISLPPSILNITVLAGPNFVETIPLKLTGSGASTLFQVGQFSYQEFARIANTVPTIRIVVNYNTTVFPLDTITFGSDNNPGFVTAQPPSTATVSASFALVPGNNNLFVRSSRDGIYRFALTKAYDMQDVNVYYCQASYLATGGACPPAGSISQAGTADLSAAGIVKVPLPNFNLGYFGPYNLTIPYAGARIFVASLISSADALNYTVNGVSPSFFGAYTGSATTVTSTVSLPLNSGLNIVNVFNRVDMSSAGFPYIVNIVRSPAAVQSVVLATGSSRVGPWNPLNFQFDSNNYATDLGRLVTYSQSWLAFNISFTGSSYSTLTVKTFDLTGAANITIGGSLSGTTNYNLVSGGVVVIPLAVNSRHELTWSSTVDGPYAVYVTRISPEIDSVRFYYGNSTTAIIPNGFTSGQLVGYDLYMNNADDSISVDVTYRNYETFGAQNGTATGALNSAVPVPVYQGVQSAKFLVPVGGRSAFYINSARDGRYEFTVSRAADLFDVEVFAAAPIASQSPTLAPLYQTPNRLINYGTFKAAQAPFVYTAAVNYSVSTVYVKASFTVANTVTVNGLPVSIGGTSGAISLPVGVPTTIVVSSTRDLVSYQIVLTRGAPDLSNVQVLSNAGASLIGFNGATNTYTATVVNSVTSASILANFATPASVTVDQGGVITDASAYAYLVSGSGRSYNLNVGANLFYIVSRTDGVYRVIITRQPQDVTAVTVYGQGLTNPITLGFTPSFSAGGNVYTGFTVTVPTRVSTISVLATFSNTLTAQTNPNPLAPSASLTLTSGIVSSSTLNLRYGTNTLVLRSPVDGTYTFTIIRTPDLSNVQFLNPSNNAVVGTPYAFDANVLSYTITVPYLQDQVLVSATFLTSVTVDSSFTQVVTPVSGVATAAYNLTVGNNNVIRVSSSASGSLQVYTFTFNRLVQDVTSINLVGTPVASGSFAGFAPAAIITSAQTGRFNFNYTVLPGIKTIRFTLTFSAVNSTSYNSALLTTGVPVELALTAGTTTTFNFVSLRDGVYSIVITQPAIDFSALVVRPTSGLVATNALATPTPNYITQTIAFDSNNVVPNNYNAIQFVWVTVSQTPVTVSLNGGAAQTLNTFSNQSSSLLLTLPVGPSTITVASPQDGTWTVTLFSTPDVQSVTFEANGVNAGSETVSPVATFNTATGFNSTYYATVPFGVRAIYVRITHVSGPSSVDRNNDKGRLVSVASTTSSIPFTVPMFNLPVGASVFNIDNAYDGQYTFIITRAAPAFTAANFVGIPRGSPFTPFAAAPVTFQPSFNPGGDIFSYYVALPYAYSSVNASFTIGEIGSATLTWNSNTATVVAGAHYNIPLPVDTTTTITVTSTEDGTYNFYVYVQPQDFLTLNAFYTTSTGSYVPVNVVLNGQNATASIPDNTNVRSLVVIPTVKTAGGLYLVTANGAALSPVNGAYTLVSPLVGNNVFNLHSALAPTNPLDGLYTLTVTRVPDLSSIALYGLGLNTSISYTWNIATTNYAISVPWAITGVLATATFSTGPINVTSSGLAINTTQALASGVESNTISLPVGTTVITFNSAVNGVFTYTITRRAPSVQNIALINDNTGLLGLSQQNFDSSVRSYSVVVPHSSSRVAVQASWARTDDVVSFSTDNGVTFANLTVNANSTWINLGANTNNTILVKSAFDGVYTYSVFRRNFDVSAVGFTAGRVDATGNLISSTVTPSNGFVAGNTANTYALSGVSFDQNGLRVQVTFATAGSVIVDVNGGQVTTLTTAVASSSFRLNPGTNVIRVISSIDGIYTFTVARAAPYSSITITDYTNAANNQFPTLTPTPAVADGVFFYNIPVSFITTSVQVGFAGTGNWVFSYSSNNVTLSGSPNAFPSNGLALPVGTTSLVVTASIAASTLQSDSVVYIFSFTRASPDISNIQLVGFNSTANAFITLATPAFNSSHRTYSVNVPYSITRVGVTTTYSLGGYPPVQANINGGAWSYPLTAQQVNFDLNVVAGSNTINVVSVLDGSYAFTVVRGTPSVQNLNATIFSATGFNTNTPSYSFTSDCPVTTNVGVVVPNNGFTSCTINPTIYRVNFVYITFTRNAGDVVMADVNGGSAQIFSAVPNATISFVYQAAVQPGVNRIRLISSQDGIYTFVINVKLDLQDISLVGLDAFGNQYGGDVLVSSPAFAAGWASVQPPSGSSNVSPFVVSVPFGVSSVYFYLTRELNPVNNGINATSIRFTAWNTDTSVFSSQFFSVALGPAGSTTDVRVQSLNDFANGAFYLFRIVRSAPLLSNVQLVLGSSNRAEFPDITVDNMLANLQYTTATNVVPNPVHSYQNPFFPAGISCVYPQICLRAGTNIGYLTNSSSTAFSTNGPSPVANTFYGVVPFNYVNATIVVTFSGTNVPVIRSSNGILTSTFSAATSPSGAFRQISATVTLPTNLVDVVTLSVNNTVDGGYNIHLQRTGFDVRQWNINYLSSTGNVLGSTVLSTNGSVGTQIFNSGNPLVLTAPYGTTAFTSTVFCNNPTCLIDNGRTVNGQLIGGYGSLRYNTNPTQTYNFQNGGVNPGSGSSLLNVGYTTLTLRSSYDGVFNVQVYAQPDVSNVEILAYLADGSIYNGGATLPLVACPGTTCVNTGVDTTNSITGFVPCLGGSGACPVVTFNSNADLPFFVTQIRFRVTYNASVITVSNNGLNNAANTNMNNAFNQTVVTSNFVPLNAGSVTSTQVQATLAGRTSVWIFNVARRAASLNLNIVSGVTVQFPTNVAVNSITGNSPISSGYAGFSSAGPASSFFRVAYAVSSLILTPTITGTGAIHNVVFTNVGNGASSNVVSGTPITFSLNTGNNTFTFASANDGTFTFIVQRLDPVLQGITLAVSSGASNFQTLSVPNFNNRAPGTFFSTYDNSNRINTPGCQFTPTPSDALCIEYDRLNFTVTWVSTNLLTASFGQQQPLFIENPFNVDSSATSFAVTAQYVSTGVSGSNNQNRQLTNGTYQLVIYSPLDGLYAFALRKPSSISDLIFNVIDTAGTVSGAPALVPSTAATFYNIPSGFQPGQLSYTLTVPFSTVSIRVYPTYFSGSTNFAITATHAAGLPLSTQSVQTTFNSTNFATFRLFAGLQTLTLSYIEPFSGVTFAYTIRITRANPVLTGFSVAIAQGAPTSTILTSTIATTAGTVYNYYATVANTVSAVSFTATLSTPGNVLLTRRSPVDAQNPASIPTEALRDVTITLGSGLASAPEYLYVGNTTFLLTSSTDGVYVVTINRQSDVTAVTFSTRVNTANFINDASSPLTVAGADVIFTPAFNPGFTGPYVAYVRHAVSAVTVTATFSTAGSLFLSTGTLGNGATGLTSRLASSVLSLTANGAATPNVFYLNSAALDGPYQFQIYRQTSDINPSANVIQVLSGAGATNVQTLLALTPGVLKYSTITLSSNPVDNYYVQFALQFGAASPLPAGLGLNHNQINATVSVSITPGLTGVPTNYVVNASGFSIPSTVRLPLLLGNNVLTITHSTDGVYVIPIVRFSYMSSITFGTTEVGSVVNDITNLPQVYNAGSYVTTPDSRSLNAAAQLGTVTNISVSERNYIYNVTVPYKTVGLVFTVAAGIGAFSSESAYTVTYRNTSNIVVSTQYGYNVDAPYTPSAGQPGIILPIGTTRFNFSSGIDAFPRNTLPGFGLNGFQVDVTKTPADMSNFGFYYQFSPSVAIPLISQCGNVAAPFTCASVRNYTNNATTAAIPYGNNAIWFRATFGSIFGGNNVSITAVSGGASAGPFYAYSNQLLAIPINPANNLVVVTVTSTTDGVYSFVFNVQTSSAIFFDINNNIVASPANNSVALFTNANDATNNVNSVNFPAALVYNYFTRPIDSTVTGVRFNVSSLNNNLAISLSNQAGVFNTAPYIVAANRNLSFVSGFMVGQNNVTIRNLNSLDTSYNLYFNRAADLTNIQIFGLDNSVLTPTPAAFVAGHLSYTLRVPFRTAAVKVLPTFATNNTVTIFYNNVALPVYLPLNSVGYPDAGIPLSAGATTTIQVRSTADFGPYVSLSYTIAITRDAADIVSSGPIIIGMEGANPSSGRVIPYSWNANTRQYTLSVENAITAITVTTAFGTIGSINIGGNSPNSNKVWNFTEAVLSGVPSNPQLLNIGTNPIYVSSTVDGLYVFNILRLGDILNVQFSNAATAAAVTYDPIFTSGVLAPSSNSVCGSVPATCNSYAGYASYATNLLRVVVTYSSSNLPLVPAGYLVSNTLSTPRVAVYNVVLNITDPTQSQVNRIVVQAPLQEGEYVFNVIRRRTDITGITLQTGVTSGSITTVSGTNFAAGTYVYNATGANLPSTHVTGRLTITTVTNYNYLQAASLFRVTASRYGVDASGAANTFTTAEGFVLPRVLSYNAALSAANSYVFDLTPALGENVINVFNLADGNYVYRYTKDADLLGVSFRNQAAATLPYSTGAAFVAAHVGPFEVSAAYINTGFDVTVQLAQAGSTAFLQHYTPVPLPTGAASCASAFNGPQSTVAGNFSFTSSALTSSVVSLPAASAATCTYVTVLDTADFSGAYRFWVLRQAPVVTSVSFSGTFAPPTGIAAPAITMTPAFVTGAINVNHVVVAPYQADTLTVVATAGFGSLSYTILDNSNSVVVAATSFASNVATTLAFTFAAGTTYTVRISSTVDGDYSFSVTRSARVLTAVTVTTVSALARLNGEALDGTSTLSSTTPYALSASNTNQPTSGRGVFFGVSAINVGYDLGLNAAGNALTNAILINGVHISVQSTNNVAANAFQVRALNSVNLASPNATNPDLATTTSIVLYNGNDGYVRYTLLREVPQLRNVQVQLGLQANLPAPLALNPVFNPAVTGQYLAGVNAGFRDYPNYYVNLTYLTRASETLLRLTYLSSTTPSDTWSTIDLTNTNGQTYSNYILNNVQLKVVNNVVQPIYVTVNSAVDGVYNISLVASNLRTVTIYTAELSPRLVQFNPTFTSGHYSYVGRPVAVPNNPTQAAILNEIRCVSIVANYPSFTFPGRVIAWANSNITAGQVVLTSGVASSPICTLVPGVNNTISVQHPVDGIYSFTVFVAPSTVSTAAAIGIAGGVVSGANVADLANFVPGVNGVVNGRYTSAVPVGNNAATLTTAVTVGEATQTVTGSVTNGASVTSTCTFTLQPNLAVGAAPRYIASCGALTVGNNVLTVIVRAGDGATTSTYSFLVVRSKSSNANLSSLIVNSLTKATFGVQQTLSVPFAPATLAYGPLTVNATAGFVTVFVGLQDNTASFCISVGGQSCVTNSNQTIPVLVNEGQTQITITVTAEDGTLQVYSVIVTRPSSTTVFYNTESFRCSCASRGDVCPAGSLVRVVTCRSTAGAMVDMLDQCYKILGPLPIIGGICYQPTPTDAQYTKLLANCPASC